MISDFDCQNNWVNNACRVLPICMLVIRYHLAYLERSYESRPYIAGQAIGSALLYSLRSLRQAAAKISGC
jgi:hypothetical protein